MNMVDSQRGGASNLAAHLVKQENEHVEIYELRGFIADTLHGALNEAYALSRGTACSKFLYSLSLNPPPEEMVKTADFLDAIDRVESKLGLSDQPRAIVFHEKKGRRHAHAVWSRIDTNEMKAVQLPFTKKKLRDISRALFMEHGWKMPEGYVNSKARDPKSFTLAEWQQAKRAGKDPRAIKTAFTDAWAISDSGSAFTYALEERGYKIARGDKRGFVGVDLHGEVYSIPRQANVKTKLVRERLGCESALPSVAEVKNQIALEMVPKIDGFKKHLQRKRQQRQDALERLRKSLVERHRRDRRALMKNLEARRSEETKQRQARFRGGLGGFWDRLRGEHKRIVSCNEGEAQAAKLRDRTEHDELIFQQLAQRRELTRAERHDVSKSLTLKHGLERDRQGFQKLRTPPNSPEQLKRAFRDTHQGQSSKTPIHGPSRER